MDNEYRWQRIHAVIVHGFGATRVTFMGNDPAIRVVSKSAQQGSAPWFPANEFGGVRRAPLIAPEIARRSPSSPANNNRGLVV